MTPVKEPDMLASEPVLIKVPAAIDCLVHSDSPTDPPLPEQQARTAPPPPPPSAPWKPSDEFLGKIPRAFARRHLILSAGQLNDVEMLLISDHGPPAAHVVANTALRLGRPVTTVPAPAESIAAAIDAAYSSARSPSRTSPADALNPSREELDRPPVLVEGSEDLESDLAAAVTAAETDLLSVEGKAPSVRLVDLILFEALMRGASDVHVQPLRDRTQVRYRLDGALHTARELPANLAASVVSRIKVMGRLDVAERRAPQDGRATVTIGGSSAAPAGSRVRTGRRVDLRISTLPSTFGERVVVRLLDPSRSPHMLSFAGLGMPALVQEQYLAQVARTSGIVLSTGPTGSGKTTTLYTTLAWISATNAGGSGRGCELNMMTIEDPVEYELAGTLSSHRADRSGSAPAVLAVSQTQVDLKKNLTFATGLRHILRQDPDVIMVGEIRDEETARIAVQASLTGHLVLSTLHTNDAAGAVARLIDLAVEPFLVASSLSAVLAQRLVRTLHDACGGEGCEQCMATGFRGRTGVFELLVVDAPIRELIGQRSSAANIKTAGQAGGMVTLREEGRRLVRAGRTTAAEVARVIEALDEVET